MLGIIVPSRVSDSSVTTQCIWSLALLSHIQGSGVSNLLKLDTVDEWLASSSHWAQTDSTVRFCLQKKMFSSISDQINLSALILLVGPILLPSDHFPVQRGFSCSDETIRYPYLPNTVSVPVCGVVSLSITFFMVGMRLINKRKLVKDC